MLLDQESFVRGTAETIVSEPKAGFGRCAKDGCPCQAFEGGMSANNCTNCGHAYGDHW